MNVAMEACVQCKNLLVILIGGFSCELWASMGNCWFMGDPSIYRVSANVKSESPRVQSPSEKEEEKEGSKLPSNNKEVEEFRGGSAANPLIAFTFNELRTITGNFRQDSILGGGGFGRVYKGFISEDLREGHRHPPIQVAVKVHDGDNSFQGYREWMAEVIFLGQLSHPNLVKLIGYCCKDEHRVLIYEFVVRGSVEANLFSMCNLASIALSRFVREKVTAIVTANLNQIIDVNYYPVEIARSNLRHRPIGIGEQGLADTFILLGMPFDSPEAQRLNKDIFETIYYHALKASSELAAKEGPYETYEGSPVSKDKIKEARNTQQATHGNLSSS